MKLTLKPFAALCLTTAGILALGVAAPTSAGYVDDASASAAAITSPPGAYTPTDLNRSTLTGAAVAGGSVYLWGALGGGLAANGKWNTAANGPSSPDVVRVDLPVTSDPLTTAPIRVAQLALNSKLTGTAEYSAGTTAIALSETGEVYTWGSNYSFKLGTGNADVTAVCSRGMTAACSNGPLLTGVKKIAATQNSFFALTEAGDLYGWGSALYGTSTLNPTGELGRDGTGKVRTSASTPTLIKQGVTDIWATLFGRYDQTASGYVFSGFGSPAMGAAPGAPNPAFGAAVVDFAMSSLTAAAPPGGERVIDIQGAPNAAGALTSKGRLLTWGSGANYLLGVSSPSGIFRTPTPITSFPAGTTVSDFGMGETHGVVALSNGQVMGWGRSYAAIGNTVAGSAGGWMYPPTLVTAAGTDNTAVAALPYTTFVTKKNFGLMGWGNVGTVAQSLLPGAPSAWSADVSSQIAGPSLLTMPGIR